MYAYCSSNVAKIVNSPHFLVRTLLLTVLTVDIKSWGKTITLYTGTSFIVNGNVVAGTSYSREHQKQ